MGFKIAAIFSDNMVLQRNKPIAVFGEGVDGTSIEATISYVQDGIEKEGSAQTVVSEGKWILYLPKMKENENCKLTVTDGETKKVFQKSKNKSTPSCQTKINHK